MEEPRKKRKHHKIYIPWYTQDEDLYEEEESGEDGWVHYIRRNLTHPIGADSPFPDSSWSYAHGGSVFDEYLEVDQEHKGDVVLYDEVIEALYKNPQLDASLVKMIVLNGIVCLFGSVKSEQEKREAEKTAERVSGVWKVRNELQIIE